jgi:hypothetical protein
MTENKETDMTEEEKRRCIILGICGGGSGLAQDNNTRKEVLAGYLSATSVAEEDLDKILGLIDEALQTNPE